MNKWCAGYLVGVLLTFGYSFNADYQPGNQFVSGAERNTVAALLAAGAWPLYWSVTAFRGLRPAQGDKS